MGVSPSISPPQLYDMAAAQPVINTPGQGPSCILYVHGVGVWNPYPKSIGDTLIIIDIHIKKIKFSLVL